MGNSGLQANMEIIFHSHASKTHFHTKGWAPSLILKVRVYGTRKWPIGHSEFPRASESLTVKGSAFDMEMIFHSYANEIHFHKQGCALDLILKVRVFETRNCALHIFIN